MRIHLSSTFMDNARDYTKAALTTVACAGGALAGSSIFCGVCDGLFGLVSGDRLADFFNPLAAKAEFIAWTGVPAVIAGTIRYRMKNPEAPHGNP